MSEQCNLYQQTDDLHIVCAWSPYSKEVTEELQERERLKKLEDENYNKKCISHTICEFHKNLLLTLDMQ